MKLKKTTIKVRGARFALREKNQEIARAYLYVLKNSLHEQPFGLLEDVFIAETFRGRGMGTRLVKEAIKEARKIGCYKIIATSRYARKRVHEFYRHLGFRKHGVEFRRDF